MDQQHRVQCTLERYEHLLGIFQLAMGDFYAKIRIASLTLTDQTGTDQWEKFVFSSIHRKDIARFPQDIFLHY